MRFNPEAKYPFVLTQDNHTLICDDLDKELETLRECVAPYEPYDCPENRKATFRELLDYYDATLKTIPRRHKSGGYFNVYENAIYVRKKDMDDSDLYYNTLSHELGHVIQHKIGILNMMNNQGLLSAQFRLEQQCDAIADIIAGCFFDFRYSPSYVNIDDALWLRGYYSKHVMNDLLIRG